uniref:Nucleotidyltransferase domain-containing protein n=1 Tax=Fervidobacterium pennivorans TaxID=93466 RepID=A0A7V4KCT0_FERPE
MIGMKEYYEMLEKNREYFERAFDITKYIAEKAKKFEECEVFIAGSFARGEHKHSSDLDILIFSDKIQDEIDLEFYSKTFKTLTGDPRVNITS